MSLEATLEKLATGLVALNETMQLALERAYGKGTNNLIGSTAQGTSDTKAATKNEAKNTTKDAAPVDNPAAQPAAEGAPITYAMVADVVNAFARNDANDPRLGRENGKAIFAKLGLANLKGVPDTDTAMLQRVKDAFEAAAKAELPA